MRHCNLVALHPEAGDGSGAYADCDQIVAEAGQASAWALGQGVWAYKVAAGRVTVANVGWNGLCYHTIRDGVLITPEDHRVEEGGEIDQRFKPWEIGVTCPQYRVSVLGAAAAATMAPLDKALFIQLNDPSVVRIINLAMEDPTWAPPPGRNKLHSYDGAEVDVQNMLHALRRRSGPTRAVRDEHHD